MNQLYSNIIFDNTENMVMIPCHEYINVVKYTYGVSKNLDKRQCMVNGQTQPRKEKD